MRLTNYVVLLALTTLTVISVNAQNTALSREKWVLTELNGRQISQTEAFIQFGNNNGRFSGNAGCNSMTGSVAIRGSSIRFSRIATTRRFCASGNAMSLEQELQQVLNRARTFTRTRGTLTIFGAKNQRAVFKPDSNPNPGPIKNSGWGLASRKWMLDSIAGNPVGTEGSEAFVVFNAAKKSAGGNSSCNSFGGSYTTAGSKIEITEIISTMRACIENEKMNIEREFLDGLREANRYEVRRNRLILYRGQRELLSFNGVGK